MAPLYVVTLDKRQLLVKAARPASARLAALEEVTPKDVSVRPASSSDLDHWATYGGRVLGENGLEPLETEEEESQRMSALLFPELHEREEEPGEEEPGV